MRKISASLAIAAIVCSASASYFVFTPSVRADDGKVERCDPLVRSLAFLDAQAFKDDVQNAGYSQVYVLEPGDTHKLK